MANTPSIAVIGSGYWGKNLVRNFHNLGALKVICDKNRDTLLRFKEQYPDIDTCSELNDILNDSNIDGVVIAAPAELHHIIAREVILSDKHVYIEKPLSLDENDGKELIALAKERQKVLMVGHLLQYHPVFRKLKEMVDSGDLGRINYIYSNRLNLGKLRREENVLWSFAPHDISMILSLAGESPESVIASGGYYLHEKLADVTTTHLEFPSGLRAHIFVSWLHPFKEQKLVVIGDAKMAVFDDTKPWKEKLLVYPHKIKWEENTPIPIKAEPETFKIEEAEPLREECLHFLQCIRDKKRPRTDGIEGLAVLEILNRSQQSLDANGIKVLLKPCDVESTKRDEFPEEIFVHPTAELDGNISIGNGTKIWHFSHILSGSIIGRSCNIGQNVVIGPDVSIGNKCKIQNNVSVYKGVTLEEGVFCGPSMVFTNVYNPRSEINKKDQFLPTLVKKGATIGANATIVCGLTIGRYSFIGAGAVINQNVLDHALVVGNPARAIGWVCRCGERLSEEFECKTCRKHYQKVEEGLVEFLEV